jgi:hypothetical protein
MPLLFRDRQKRLCRTVGITLGAGPGDLVQAVIWCPAEMRWSEQGASPFITYVDPWELDHPSERAALWTPVPAERGGAASRTTDQPPALRGGPLSRGNFSVGPKLSGGSARRAGS